MYEEVLAGVVAYALLAALVWALVEGRFPLVTSRMPVGKPGKLRYDK